MSENYYRSPRLVPFKVEPEVFTSQDYVEARALEQVYESISLEYDIALPDQTNPNKTQVKASAALLGLTLDDRFKSCAANLLQTAAGITDEIRLTNYQHMLPLEEAAYGREYLQHEQAHPLKPFLQQLRYLTARYVVEEAEERETHGSSATRNLIYENVMHAAMQELQILPELASQLYVVDIPAYTRLYDIFDDMRQANDRHLEIYLGRDGIYAYYGRIGELAARGDIGDNLLQGGGEVLRSRTRYMVYSRSILGQNPELKERYISQQLGPEDSPQFFDTGYNGTIPEDIMKVLGFDWNEFNQRIHLLESSNPSRQINGLPKRVYIGPIEDGPKPEQASISLCEDNQGDVCYVAKPSTIAEQFRFACMRTILLRHFWLKQHESINKLINTETITTAGLRPNEDEDIVK